jgi:hypothetical protein
LAVSGNIYVGGGFSDRFRLARVVAGSVPSQRAGHGLGPGTNIRSFPGGGRNHRPCRAVPTDRRRGRRSFVGFGLLCAPRSPSAPAATVPAAARHRGSGSAAATGTGVSVSSSDRSMTPPAAAGSSDHVTDRHRHLRHGELRSDDHLSRRRLDRRRGANATIQCPATRCSPRRRPPPTPWDRARRSRSAT